MKVMSKLILVMLVLLGLLPTVFAADDFKEGKDYQLLTKPMPTSTGDKVEVIEVFSYACPHCFSLEPSLEEWLKNKPANAEFIRLPASLGHAVWEPLVRAYYTAAELGVVDKINRPLFDAIHVEKRQLTTPEQVADIFVAQGVDREAFLKAYRSFVVETHTQRAKQLMLRYEIRGVPAFIVNGKYFADVSTAGSEQRLFEVINYLIAKESSKG
jgi:thiol:disulfide interchange protein DsbA